MKKYRTAEAEKQSSPSRGGGSRLTTNSGLGIVFGESGPVFEKKQYFTRTMPDRGFRRKWGMIAICPGL